MFYSYKKKIILFVTVFLSGTLYSQNNLSFFFKYISKINQVAVGNVRAIIQDNKGFMWIATQDGLFKYDSKSFVVYNSQMLDTQHTIGGSDIRNICVDSSHNMLWVISSFGGLNGISLINDKVELGLSEENTPLLRNVLFSSLCNSGDSLFIGTQKGIYLYAKSKRVISQLSTGNTIFNSPIDNIFKYKNRLFLFTRNDGIYVYDYLRQTITLHADNSTISSSNELRFYNVTRFDENTWYAGTSDGVKKITINSPDSMHIDKNPFRTISEINNKNIFGISTDINKNLWISNEDNVLMINPVNSHYSVITENNFGEKSNWLESTYTIFCDKQNTVWLGCQKGLAFTVNGTPSFNAYSKSSNSPISINHSYYLGPIDDSTIYVCAENGLYKTNINNGNIEVIDATIPYDYIFTDPNKRNIVSNYKGTFTLKKTILTPLAETYPEFDRLHQLRINSCIRINDSCLVLGTENYKGIVVWDYHNHRIEQYSKTSGKIRLKEDIINNVISISRDSFAVLGNEFFTIVDFSKRTCTTLSLKTSSGKDYVLFFDLCRVKNKYYLSSYGMGVIVLDRNFNIVDKISTIEGLSNNGIYKLLPWRDKLLFITTNNGLNVYNTVTGDIKTFYKSDGMHGDAFEETSGNIYNNILFAGGANGFTVINPNYIKPNNNPPLVYFNKIHMQLTGANQFDTTNVDAKHFTIPNNIIQTNIYFAGISYSNPERTIFAYRITEQGNIWVNLSTQNFITLIGLSPGTYHLQVQAFNEDGVASEIKELTLIFLPKWYQTWWFKLLLVLAAIGAVYGLYRIRINQLKKEQKIKTRLASDLHDDLGSTMNSVKVYANLALMEKEPKKYLLKIKEGTQEAITGIKDMIWVLDDSKGSIEDLLARVSLFASSLCEANKIQYKSEITDEARNHKLGQEERRNLYMMLKEAVNNAIKYADASQIIIAISVKKGKPDISIKDDGKGFDTNTATEGNGLKNMNRRAKEIKYDISVKSAHGKGTAISFQKI